MKTKNILFSILTLWVGLSSCSLEEINPSGVTVDKVAATKLGYEKLINSCYFDLSRYFYGRSLLLITEGGTDSWTSDLNSNNNQNYMKYASGGAMSIDMAKDHWNGAYDAINYCNMVIDRVDQVQDFTNDAEKNAKVAEAYFLRALYYFHLVEQFGPVVLTLKETTAAETNATRTAPMEIYEKAIIPDLRFAIENLPTTAVAGKPTKKAALGLLAKACLQTKEYGSTAYLAEALSTAKKLIENQATYQTQLYANFQNNFNAANNKNNQEALYQIPYSQAYGSTNVFDHNNDFKNFYSTPTAFGAILAAGFQLEVGRWSGGNFMPSKYLLDVFKNADGTLDPRYALSFQTTWTANTNYAWTTDAIKQFDRSSAVPVGTPLASGSLAIKLANPADADYAAQRPSKLTNKYLWVDLADIYGSDNKVKMKYTRVNVDAGEVDNPFLKFYPSLTKFNSGSLISPKSNNYTSDANATVMRLGEVYLIAAEADFYLNGASGTAAGFINTLRNRVGAPTISAADLNVQFILDERARELCGEYTRWYDLKRTGKLTKEYLMEKNPDVGQYFINGVHALRPIPQGQMDAISNPAGFQNPGY
ncbi:RagB/SusD family nutrient uptake outer membrane protein [Pedobacter sp.]|uniref:RagB/SusD family nutrient uptake outer membrane protein n=1 Tax=Pedobacter sp. TaxID=1411316 RepID=UPI003D7FC861